MVVGAYFPCCAASVAAEVAANSAPVTSRRVSADIIIKTSRWRNRDLTTLFLRGGAAAELVEPVRHGRERRTVARALRHLDEKVLAIRRNVPRRADDRLEQLNRNADRWSGGRCLGRLDGGRHQSGCPCSRRPIEQFVSVVVPPRRIAGLRRDAYLRPRARK